MDIRTAMNLVESAQTLTPQLLTQTIKEITQEWIAQGKVKSVRAIGNGHCYDFTRAVMDRLNAPGYGDYFNPKEPGLQTVRTEDFDKNDFYTDIAKLRRMKEPVPTDIPTRELASLIGSATHEWMYFQGKHYDATAPQGVPHMLDLPFFKNQINGLRRELTKRGKA